MKLQKDNVVNRDIISVIVPVYNAEEYLEECIESILDQIYEDIELLLINDGSKDSSLEICKEWESRDDRIRVINQENMGVSAARNRGLKEAAGNWVAFIDSDDIIDRNYLQFLYDAAINNDCKISTCRRYRFTDKAAIEYVKDKDPKEFCSVLPKEEAVKVALKIGGFLGSCTNKLFSVSVLLDEDKKSLRFDENIYFGEDILFFYQALMNSDSLAYINLVMYFYRDNPQSAVNQSWNWKWDSVITAHERVCELTKDFDKGKYYPHIYYQEACISLFLRRYRSKNPMGRDMKKKVKRVVWDRWYYLLFEKDIHIIIKLAAVPMMISTGLTEFLYKIYLRLAGAL